MHAVGVDRGVWHLMTGMPSLSAIRLEKGGQVYLDRKRQFTKLGTIKKEEKP